LRNLIRGAIAGTAGVAGMAGVITTLRRALLTNEQLAGTKTHPEKVVEAMAARAGIDELDDQTRRRLGDTIHFGYGALWGAVFATGMRRNDIHPLTQGAALGAGLWAAGFGAVLPALKAHPPFWQWTGSREFVLTSSAHVAYGIATATVLKALRN
jgi:hypothetical protein